MEIIQNNKPAAKEESKIGIKKEIKEKTIYYILAAFGLVAGLAWNEAVKSLIEYVFPAAGNSIVAKIFYAVALTIILVVISAYLTKQAKDNEAPRS